MIHCTNLDWWFKGKRASKVEFFCSPQAMVSFGRVSEQHWDKWILHKLKVNQNLSKKTSQDLRMLSRSFQMPRVVMWGLSLYCCISHRCCTAEQRLMTTLTITTSAAMSLLRAFVMVQVTMWLSITYPQCHISASQSVRVSQLLIVSLSHVITKSLPLSLTTLQCSEDA